MSIIIICLHCGSTNVQVATDGSIYCQSCHKSSKSRVIDIWETTKYV